MEEQQHESSQEKTVETKGPNLILKRYIQIVVLLLVLVGAFLIGFEKGKNSVAYDANPVPIRDVIIKNDATSADKELDFSLFWSVWNLLKSKYVDASGLDARKLFYGAIKGMLAATGDPYTTFFDPNENKQFNEEITGSFEGIGAELGVKNGVLTVIAPLDGTPAQKAGLRAGDKIAKIDGKSTADMSIEDAVNMIHGKKGTSVTLTIFRAGDDNTQDISVVRDTINVSSVTLEFKNGNIAYIKISRFGDDTSKGFSDAINKAMAQHAKGLIVDLRNDPGGYLNSAIDVASKLLPGKKIVVMEEDGSKNRQNMYTEGGDVASGLETVVLINEGSASASEILAGALRENRDNVTLVGKKSFGKGSVQEFINLPQGTAAKITVARWLTPKGEQINEVGISPDMDVDLTNDDYNNNRDPQMDQALKTLNEKISAKN